MEIRGLTPGMSSLVPDLHHRKRTQILSLAARGSLPRLTTSLLVSILPFFPSRSFSDTDYLFFYDARADYFATVSVQPGKDEVAALASRVSAVPGCEKFSERAAKKWFRAARYWRITRRTVPKEDDGDVETGTEQTSAAPVEAVSGQ